MGIELLALFVAAWLLGGVGYGDDGWTLVLAGAVFTLANAWVKPIFTVLSIVHRRDARAVSVRHQHPDARSHRLDRHGLRDRRVLVGAAAAVIVSLVNALLNPCGADEQRSG